MGLELRQKIFDSRFGIRDTKDAKGDVVNDNEGRKITIARTRDNGSRPMFRYSKSQLEVYYKACTIYTATFHKKLLDAISEYKQLILEQICSQVGSIQSKITAIYKSLEEFIMSLQTSIQQAKTKSVSSSLQQLDYTTTAINNLDNTKLWHRLSTMINHVKHLCECLFSEVAYAQDKYRFLHHSGGKSELEEPHYKPAIDKLVISRAATWCSSVSVDKSKIFYIGARQTLLLLSRLRNSDSIAGFGKNIGPPISIWSFESKNRKMQNIRGTGVQYTHGLPGLLQIQLIDNNGNGIHLMNYLKSGDEPSVLDSELHTLENCALFIFLQTELDINVSIHNCFKDEDHAQEKEKARKPLGKRLPLSYFVVQDSLFVLFQIPPATCFSERNRRSQYRLRIDALLRGCKMSCRAAATDSVSEINIVSKFSEALNIPDTALEWITISHHCSIHRNSDSDLDALSFDNAGSCRDNTMVDRQSVPISLSTPASPSGLTQPFFLRRRNDTCKVCGTTSIVNDRVHNFVFWHYETGEGTLRHRKTKCVLEQRSTENVDTANYVSSGRVGKYSNAAFGHQFLRYCCNFTKIDVTASSTLYGNPRNVFGNKFKQIRNENVWISKMESAPWLQVEFLPNILASSDFFPLGLIFRPTCVRLEMFQLQLHRSDSIGSSASSSLSIEIQGLSDKFSAYRVLGKFENIFVSTQKKKELVDDTNLSSAPFEVQKQGDKVIITLHLQQAQKEFDSAINSRYFPMIRIAAIQPSQSATQSLAFSNIRLWGDFLTTTEN